MAGVTEFNDSKDNLIVNIKKRDGRVVNFMHSKISNAIYKALVVTGKADYPLAERLANRVIEKMVQSGYGSTGKVAIASVEDVQDMVESILIEESLSETAKAYILYRHERRKVRDENGEIIEGPKQMFERVAILVALPDVLHDSQLFNLTGRHNQNIEEAEKYYAKIDDF